jgi:hypothetical protein
MVIQSLARFPEKIDVFKFFKAELSCAADTDSLMEGCCVRYLCRDTSISIDESLGAYKSMLKKGVVPDLCTVECLVEACMRAGRHDLVRPLILELGDYGIEPSPTLYASFVSCCGLTGAVACGMAAFARMRMNTKLNSDALKLGFSSAIHMCVQNHEVDRALEFLAEGRHALSTRGEPTNAWEAQLLPAILVAAVQTARKELALEVALHVREAISAAHGTADSCSLAARASELCKKLSKRQTSRALMEQIVAVLDGASPHVCSTGFCEKHGVGFGKENVNAVLNGHGSTVNKVNGGDKLRYDVG